MSEGDQHLKKARPEKDEDYDEIEDDDDQSIPDDGIESSEHSSIDLEAYQAVRDNIPSEPSDASEDSEEEDEDYEEEEEQNEEESAAKEKGKKETLQAKKVEKQAGK